jgi:predicted small lipoprotein YifL
VALADRRIVVRAVLAVVLVSAVGLSACGRKGALEPPPGPAATVSEDGAQTDAKKGKQAKPNRPFALDFLL